MKVLKNIIIFIVIIALLTTIFLGFHFTKEEEKKAIIFLPGFMGSILRDEENIYWLTYDVYGTNYEEPWRSKKPFMTRLFDVIQDEEGNHRVDMQAASPDNEEFFGGTFDIYLELYNLLNERFSDEYDIVTFHYDFMRSDKENGEKLDAYIKEKGFESVVLIAHSMGGLVADNYIALGQEQRDKVALLSTFGTPHGGVLDSLIALETKDFGGIPSELLPFIKPIIYNMIRNMPSLLQMLPNKVLLDSPYYKNAESGHSSFIRIETSQGEYRYMTDWEEIKEFYATREWSKYIDDEEKRGQTKPMFLEALEMFDNLYYQKGSNYEHITDKVNTYYFVGQLYTHKGKNCLQYNLDGSVDILRAYNYGDNTISVPSASCGKDLESKNVFIYSEGHNGLVNNINQDKQDPIDKFCELVNNL